MTTDFPFVATNTFSPSPANSYIQQQQAFMTGLAAKLERDEITGIDEQDVEIQRLCAAADEAPEVVAEPKEEPQRHRYYCSCRVRWTCRVWCKATSSL